MPDLTVPGTRVTPIPKGIASRVGEAVRYVISGVTPATWFGPMQPLAPMAPEGTAGRAFDYPTGYNLQYQPRGEEPLSFATLRALADGCDMLRLVIETRKDQIEGQDWDVRPRKLADGSHPRASAFATEIQTAKDFFASPDREHDFSGWVRAVAEELFVIDAVSIYLRPDRKGRVFGFELVDGSTISPRIDAWGRTPAAPDVAYQQILHGVPAADFSTDQLIYFPRNRRPGHVYGYSPVEQVIATANTLVRRTAHQLSFYTDGNLVDGLFVAPSTWTNAQVSDWQVFWDAQFAGNLPQRRHGIWVPGNVDFKSLKQPDLKDPFDEFLARIICFAFSISPQPFVSMMNRATAESAHDSAVEEGLVPVLNYFRRLFRLMFDSMGWQDIEMVPVDDRETDPKTADDIDVNDVKAGIRTVNEVRTSRGLDPLPGGDVLMVATGSGYVPLGNTNSGVSAEDHASLAHVALGRLSKDWNSDLHPRWPARAPDSRGGKFAPKGEDVTDAEEGDVRARFSEGSDGKSTSSSPVSAPVQPAIYRQDTSVSDKPDIVLAEVAGSQSGSPQTQISSDGATPPSAAGAASSSYTGSRQPSLQNLLISPAESAPRSSRPPVYQNVVDFVRQHYGTAQRLARQIPGVTPAMVLAALGRESAYGTNYMATSHGNYGGIHFDDYVGFDQQGRPIPVQIGQRGIRPFLPGQTGTFWSAGTPSPNNSAIRVGRQEMAEFPLVDGFELSGQIQINRIAPYVPQDGIKSPEQFFTILHEHGYGPTNPRYLQDTMRQEPGNWGAYWLVLAAANSIKLPPN